MTTLRILCLGDSLTEGYTEFGGRFLPYSATLQSALEAILGGREGMKVEVVTDGVSGDLVCRGWGSFEGRLGRRYEQSSTRSPLYDWVIILGGTDDLAYRLTPLSIHDALTSLSDTALENGAKVLLCTVPECAVVNETLDTNRDSLNRLIASEVRDEVYIFDLHKAIPYHSMDKDEREEIWDDGLHFTGKGYERFGRLIAERLGEIFDAEVEGAKVEG